jgi:hypothetical protein
LEQLPTIADAFLHFAFERLLDEFCGGSGLFGFAGRLDPRGPRPTCGDHRRRDGARDNGGSHTLFPFRFETGKPCWRVALLTAILGRTV